LLGRPNRDDEKHLSTSNFQLPTSKKALFEASGGLGVRSWELGAGS
jgi:hypothetical protein